jgi:hypothetical protein
LFKASLLFLVFCYIITLPFYLILITSIMSVKLRNLLIFAAIFFFSINQAQAAVSNTINVDPAKTGVLDYVFTDGNMINLVVPPRAISAVTTFSVSQAPLNNWSSPTGKYTLVSGQTYNIRATSVDSFSSDLTITLGLPDMPADIGSLGVFYFNDVLGVWERIPGAIFNSAEKKVIFTANHLPTFAVFQVGKDVFSIATSANTLILGSDYTAELVTEQEAKNIFNQSYSVLDSAAEVSGLAKITALSGATSLDQSQINAVNKFVVYGTDSTDRLGAGERLGVIGSFYGAFGYLPKTISDFSDVVSIANGRWPKMTSDSAIDRAEVSFKKVYRREANMSQANDNAAVTIIAYGLRNANRNLSSERAALKIYKAIFGSAPATATNWDTVRAIAYSGAKR